MAFFPSLLFGASVFTLYSPSWLILALHLLIRQVPIQVPVPSAASPCFLLVAITEATLFRHRFSLIWLRRLWTHSMRRGRIYLEPPPHRTPTWVLFYSPLLLGAFWKVGRVVSSLAPQIIFNNQREQKKKL